MSPTSPDRPMPHTDADTVAAASIPQASPSSSAAEPAPPPYAAELALLEKDAAAEPVEAPWKILLVDGDPAFAQRVRQSVGGFRFEGRPLQVIAATSADEAITLIDNHPDLAIAALDPTLDGQQLWRQVARYLREEKNNRRALLVLCADTAAALPDPAEMESLSIDDHWIRDHLRNGWLRTAIVRHLRAHTTGLALAAGRKGLARMVVATSGLLELKTPELFYRHILPRVVGLLDLGRDALLCTRGHPDPADRAARVRSGLGRYTALAGADLTDASAPRALAALRRLDDGADTIVEVDFCALRLSARGGIDGMIYVEGLHTGSVHEWQTLELFRNKANIAFNNMLALEELNAAQEATVLALARLAEYKENVASDLQRVERLTGEVARELHRRGSFPDELTDTLLEHIGLASILHDVGMISISDETLGIPGELGEEHRQFICRHTEIGHRILIDAARPLRGHSFLTVAAEIARYHHERYDGSGYMDGIKGREIPLAARITAVVDVFDALISERPYRRPLSVEKAIAWIQERAGRDFDPEVVDAFVQVVQRLIQEHPSWFPDPQLSAPVGVIGTIGRALGTFFGNRASPHG